MTLAATDLFAGAGGSTLGSEAAGVATALAINHWEPAVRTLEANHPGTVIEQADLRVTSPERYFKTDLLLASPSCLGHSKARKANARPADPAQWRPDVKGERARATMWDVLEWVDVYAYDAIVLENVVEWRSNSGMRAFLAALSNLAETSGGYDYRFVYANSRFHGVPQSRDRLFLVAWKRAFGRAPDLDFGPEVTCATCGPVSATQAFKSDFEVRRREALDRWAAGRRKKRSIVWGMWGPTGQWFWACSACGDEVDVAEPTAAEIIDGDADATTFAERFQGGYRLPDNLADRIRRGLTGPWRGRSGAFIVLNNGSSSGASGGRVYPAASQPVNAVTTTNPLCVLDVPDGYEFERDGFGPLGYRRTTVDEIRRACAFPDDYRLVGTSGDRYCLLGNAVTPPVMRDLVGRVADLFDAA